MQENSISELGRAEKCRPSQSLDAYRWAPYHRQEKSFFFFCIIIVATISLISLFLLGLCCGATLLSLRRYSKVERKFLRKIIHGQRTWGETTKTTLCRSSVDSSLCPRSPSLSLFLLRDRLSIYPRRLMRQFLPLIKICAFTFSLFIIIIDKRCYFICALWRFR